MRNGRFAEAQIFGMLKEQEASMPTAEVCRRHGLSLSTFYKLKTKFGGMEVSEATRLKTLEDANTGLLQPLACSREARHRPAASSRSGTAVLFCGRSSE